MAQSYRNGFKCHKCPGRNDEEGCPAWVEFAAQDVASGRDEFKKMCIFQALPVFLIEVIKASNRPAAEIGACRASIEQGFLSMAAGLHMVGTNVAAQLAEHKPEPRLVGGGSPDRLPEKSAEPGG